MNSKVFFGRMTAVWTVKTQRKPGFHRIWRTEAQLSRYGINSSASKTCFVTVVFRKAREKPKATWGRGCVVRSYLKTNYPKSLQFAHKITLAFEIHWMMFFLFRCLLLPSPSSLFALNFEEFQWKISRSEDLEPQCCVCVSFALEIVRDSPMVNVVYMICALLTGRKVYVAWKRKMLHDVIGRHQAYIHREIYGASNFAAG